jgi:hypothetical protein
VENSLNDFVSASTRLENNDKINKNNLYDILKK